MQWLILWCFCSDIFLYMVTLTDMSMQSKKWKLVPAYFMHTRSSIPIRVPRALITICLCSILSILSTRAIAFVVDFSIQYYYYVDSYSTYFAGISLPSLSVSWFYLLCLNKHVFLAMCIVSLRYFPSYFLQTLFWVTPDSQLFLICRVYINVNSLLSK